MHYIAKVIANAINTAYAATNDGIAATDALDTLRQDVGAQLAKGDFCDYTEFSERARIIKTPDSETIKEALAHTLSKPVKVVPTPRYVVDGHETDDLDSALVGYGQFAPFRIFHPESQTYVPGSFATRLQAQFLVDGLNHAAMPEPALEIKVWSSGWNIPGYLCDDEPMNCETWQQATDALLEALHQAYDDDSISGVEAQQYLDAIDQLKRADPEFDWSTRIGNYLWWVQHVTLPANEA